MMIGNTFDKKNHEKLISYKSGRHATVVDYILMEKGDLKMITDVKVIPGEECFAQHRLLVMDMKWNKVVKEESSMLKIQVKLWKLKDEKMQRRLGEELEREILCAVENWDEWGKTLMNIAKRVCGATNKHKKRKISWWWNTQVAEAIREQRRLYKNWQKKRDDILRQKYWYQKKEVKRIIATVREREMEHTLERLTEQKTKKLKQSFRMARQASKTKRILLEYHVSVVRMDS